jgi:hypothetical protein
VRRGTIAPITHSATAKANTIDRPCENGPEIGFGKELRPEQYPAGVESPLRRCVPGFGELLGLQHRVQFAAAEHVYADAVERRLQLSIL